jgi:hypothetical protein
VTKVRVAEVAVTEAEIDPLSAVPAQLENSLTPASCWRSPP